MRTRAPSWMEPDHRFTIVRSETGYRHDGHPPTEIVGYECDDCGAVAASMTAFPDAHFRGCEWHPDGD